MPALILGACASDVPDARPDATAADARAPDATVAATLDGAAGDAAPDDAGAPGDASGARDAGSAPAPDLIGTRFERVGVVWRAPLELCTAFRTGDLAGALASRLHVTLAPAARARLGRDDLAQATLDDGRLRTSPLAADQRALGAVTSSLAAWRLDDPQGRARLSARLVHQVAGGQLIEELAAVRDGTSDAPVDIDALDEVFFTFVDAATGRTIPLERCGVGSAELRDHREVLVAEGPGGETLAILRDIRTQPVDAGSAPVTLLRGQVSRSSEPWARWVARGFFAWTYAASLHNWNEQSALDFSLDPGLWHTEFRPGLAGSVLPEAIERIELARINAVGAAGEVRVVERTLTSGATRSTAWRALGTWRSVDADALHPACGGGRVDTLVLTEAAIVHVVRCPGGTIEAVMPVLFAWDHRRDGEIITGAELTPVDVDGHAGVRAPLSGQAGVDVAIWDATTYLVRVRDDAGASAYTGLAQPWSGAWDTADEVLERASADGAVRVRLVRRWVWQGVGESSIFAPLSLVVEHDGLRHDIDAFDRLTYTNTHHNWFDGLVARTETHEITWRASYENGPVVESVRVTRLSDGAEVLAETRVE